MTSPSRTHLYVAALLVVALTLFFRLTGTDLAWSSLFYSPAGTHWPLESWGPFGWLHHRGEWPGRILAAGALAGLATSWRPALKSWRRPCLYLVLVFLLGPGLLVNVLGKELMAR